MIANFLIAMTKVCLGIIDVSYFLCISGLYSFLIGYAKIMYFDGLEMEKKDENRSNQYFSRMGYTIVLASIAYIVYMSRLFIMPNEFNYDTYISIIMAVVSCFEMIFAINGIIRSSRSKDTLVIGVKCVNLAASCTALVFVQVAILSFTNINVKNINAISGVVFGLLSLFVGLFMITKARKFNVEKEPTEEKTQYD